MLAGEFYWAADPSPIVEREQARHLTRLYNSTTEDELEQRSQILRQLFGTLETNTEIEPPSTVIMAATSILVTGCI